MRFLICIAALFCFVSSPSYSRDYTYADLVRKIIDLESLAELPAAGERGMQASSYDRESKFDSVSGKYLSWDRNADNAGMAGVENGKAVMADIKGPGVIWRVWSALPETGHVRMYLDGSEIPVLDQPFKDWFDNSKAPFNFPELVRMKARGLTNNVPIPFQKSCKIIADPKWGAYYHFTYSVYPKHTTLPTFSLALIEENRDVLQQVDRFLAQSLGTDPAGKRPGESIIHAAGNQITAINPPAPSQITAIRIKLPMGLSDEQLRKYLRETTLSIYWDGEENPSVWTPLGDFFGSAPGVNHYKSLPLGMSKEELYSFWVMPFATSARIVIDGDQALTSRIRLSVTVSPYPKAIQNAGRFHAKWHRGAFPSEDPIRAAIDWPVLRVNGEGRYAGMMLEVWNPRGGWWGEGDEKFFVDGEVMPSTFGTGSEDYFGYAWCDPELFSHGLHNQTISQGNKGHISVNRWHIADNVPFQRSFDGYIEKYFSDTRPTMFAATVYFYLVADGNDPYKPVSLEDRTNWYPPAEIYKVSGAIEGESLKAAATPPGILTMQELVAFSPFFSGDAHLWWNGASPGSRLLLNLPVEKAGRYSITLGLTRGPDYSIVQHYLNGQPLGSKIDLYSPRVEPYSQDVGVIELKQGDNLLEVEITGKNSKSKMPHMSGLDYILPKLLE